MKFTTSALAGLILLVLVAVFSIGSAFGSITPFAAVVSLGKLCKLGICHDKEHKFGRYANVGSGAQVDVTDCGQLAGGPDTYQFSTAAETHYVSSDDAGDASVIEVVGLGADWREVTQQVTVSGTTPVVLPTPLIRVNRAFNDGSTDWTGNVYVHVDATPTAGVPSTPADFRTCILAGNNQTAQAVYTVPDGFTFLIYSYCASANSTGTQAESATFKALFRQEGKVWRLGDHIGPSSFGAGEVCKTLPFPSAIEARTDVRIFVDSVASAGADVTATIDGLLWNKAFR